MFWDEGKIINLNFRHKQINVTNLDKIIANVKKLFVKKCLN